MVNALILLQMAMEMEKLIEPEVKTTMMTTMSMNKKMMEVLPFLMMVGINAKKINHYNTV